ncbi:MAG: UvrD-helicase domain-containing protein [Spirochaetaceae bacterium]|nr:UvrD-helicase domain-containing protein [Spirochaetaceae bacterium]
MGSLDTYQQAAVLADKNTVVTAGAGSGKTTVLAERFVHLIAGGRARVDGILTLTFTRKAAAEMYERIYRQLVQRAESEADAQRRERLSAAVAEFDTAHISTLDSFCSQIVRGGSVRFGISGDFRADEYSAAQMVEETSLSFLLQHAEDSSLEQFLQDFGTQSVLERLLIPLAKREFHLAVEHDFEAMLEQQFTYLRQKAHSLAGTLQEKYDWFFTADLPDKTSVHKALNLLKPLSSPAGAAEAGQWGLLSEICEVKLVKGGGKTTDPRLIELKEKIDEWRKVVEQLGPILMLLQKENLYRGLYALLNEYQQEIHTAKRSSGVLTFRDVVEMAVRLLQEDVQLRSHYKGLFTHIMIDEFQDNNDLQRRLLFLLAEKKELSRTDGPPAPEELEAGKLFFVGDEKQSIYRFRGADVRVLKQLQQQLEASGGEALQLPNNYRSHSGLIRFFNTLFAEVMQPAAGLPNEASEIAGGRPTQSETKAPEAAGVGFEAEFTPLEAPQEHLAFTPTVRLLYKPYEKDAADEEDNLGESPPLHSKDAEAWHIVNYLKQVIGGGHLMVRDRSVQRAPGEKEAVRPAVYDDVAILMRSSGNQINFERYMRHLQIPYNVQSTRSLFLEAPINDMYQFLQVVLYPKDKAAYAALLRSPFVNLSDEVTARILRGGNSPEGEIPEIIAFSLSGDEELFGDEGQVRKYKRAAEAYRVLRDLAATAPIADMIRYLWYEAGYRYVVLRNPDYHAYLEFYDALVELARRSDGRGEGLASFLDFLRENLGQFEKLEDLEIIPRRSGGVNLLSIHKSKGLEFPVVIVADMGNSGLSGGDGNLYVWDEEFGLALSGGEKGSKIHSYFAQSAKEEEELQDYAELKRLLYVACTRAEDHLILSGFHHAMNRNLEKSSGKNVLLNITLQALGWGGGAPEEALCAERGCELEIIPEVTEEMIDQTRHASRARSLASAARRIDEVELVERWFVRRELTAVELNRLYLEAAGEHPAGDGFEAAGASKAAASPTESPEELPAIAVDQLLSDRKAAGPFGELVHRCIEAELIGSPGRPALPPLFSGLEPEQVVELEGEARRMAAAFLGSPLGREAAAAAEQGTVESELPFLLQLDGAENGAVQDGAEPTSASEDRPEFLLRGQIDLLLQRPEEVLIVDFKTDRFCRPAEYAAQMAVYRRAAAELYGLPARSMLVYVRDGRVEELSIPVELEGLCARAAYSG